MRITAAFSREDGFSLPELLIATGLLLAISSAVTSGLLQITKAQKTIGNRVDLHAGIRSATELLQQEVGQAGRVVLPYPTVLGQAVPGVAGTPPGTVTVTVSQTINGAPVLSVAGIYPSEYLIVDSGDLQRETVQVSTVDTVAKTITAYFNYTHAAGAAINAYGGFAQGIVPPTWANGSTGSVLKLFGDINGDGNMVYIEYKCDPQPSPGGNFYRSVTAYDAAVAAKTVPGPGQVLLTNLLPNPDGSNCFRYETATGPAYGSPRNPAWFTVPYYTNPDPFTYVVDVAVTLTVQTQNVDPVTRQYQPETKALLNVSPRNVFDVWRLDVIGNTNRVQWMPPSVNSLLP